MHCHAHDVVKSSVTSAMNVTAAVDRWLQVYGHVGECRTGMPAHFDYYRPGGASSHGAAPSPRPVVAAADDQSDAVDDDDDAADEDVVAESTTSCVVEGDINTTDTWHVIGNASRTTTALSDAAWFKFDFTFPQSMMLLNMGIYGEAEQTRLLEDDDSCWHKHSVIPSQRVHDRVRPQHDLRPHRTAPYQSRRRTASCWAE